MKKLLLLVVCIFLCSASLCLFASKHGLEICDFTLRGHVGFAGFANLLGTVQKPYNAVPVEAGGQFLFHVLGLSAGVEVGILGEAETGNYFIPFLFVIGFTDLLTIKFGYSLPLGDVLYSEYEYGEPTAATPLNVNLFFINTIEGEVGLLTLYYNRVLFSLYTNVRLIMGAKPDGEDVMIPNFSLGLRIGLKPKNRSMVNLGWFGLGYWFH